MRKRDLKAGIDALDARLAEVERQVMSRRRDDGRAGAEDRPAAPSPFSIVDALRAEVDSLKAELSAAAAGQEAWKSTAFTASRNCDYYRGLVIQVGEAIGESAYICDDGSRSQDVLCNKVPELAREILTGERSRLAPANGAYPA